jgi:hypothetical protein
VLGLGVPGCGIKESPNFGTAAIVAGATLIVLLEEGVTGIFDRVPLTELGTSLMLGSIADRGSGGRGFFWLLTRLATAVRAADGGGLEVLLGVPVILPILAAKLETGSIFVLFDRFDSRSCSGCFLTGEGVGGRLFSSKAAWD